LTHPDDRQYRPRHGGHIPWYLPGLRRYDDLGPLGRALLPVYIGRRFPVVAALAAYLDESGEAEADDRRLNKERKDSEWGIYAIAGYIGDVDMWDVWHAPAWQYAVIDKSPRKIDEFKASDCFGRHDQYQGWTDEEVRARFDAAVSITTQCCESDKIAGFASAVRFRREHMGHPDFDMERAGFSYCMFQALYIALRLSAETLKGTGEIQIVCDKKPKFKALTDEYFELARDHLKDTGFDPGAVQDPIFRDSKEISVLQAADLLAYETRKEVRSRLENGRWPVRKSLARLVAERRHEANCISWESVLEMNRLIKAGLPSDHIAPELLFASGEPWRGAGHWPRTVSAEFKP
jgi:hypothetical protein